MIDKIKFILPLLIVNIFIFSCTKHHDSPLTPPQPEPFDTLGAGWQRIQVDPSLDFEDIFFVNNQTGYLCGQNYLGKSTDGGLTWKRIIPDSLNQGFINIFFADANNGWVFGGANFSLKTNDGGTTWQKINRSGLFDGQFFDANNGYITSVSGTYKTSDGGITLQQVNSLASGGLFFQDQNNGWIEPNNGGSNPLYKTSNAGISFAALPQIISAGEYAIQFTDSLHGFAAGIYKVYKTVDGGTTIQTLLSNSVIVGGDIQFFDNNNGFILGGGNIYSTTDGGTTLNKICAIHKALCYEISFTDLNHGWSAGHGGYVYRYVKP